MTPDDVLDRLREELDTPLLQIKVEEKTYTEEEYQIFKEQLLNYFKEYVQDVEN